jgi:hypothetical protein
MKLKDHAAYERGTQYRYKNPEKESIWNEQFNILNKNLNQKIDGQSGASWK